MTIHAVLFDLDGTLADTAPDLAAALNQLRIEKNLPPIPPEQLRPYTSQGVRGLLKNGMSIHTDAPEYQDLANKILSYYAANICEDTTLFPDIPALLQRLEEQNIMWGIVTNKHSRFTEPLLAALGLLDRAGCIVSGDTTAHPKPAADPLLYATQVLNIDPKNCIYVGDDERDVIAGQASGMATLAAAWGYLGIGAPIETWGADHIIQTPLEVLDYIQ